MPKKTKDYEVTGCEVTVQFRDASPAFELKDKLESVGFVVRAKETYDEFPWQEEKDNNRAAYLLKASRAS